MQRSLAFALIALLGLTACSYSRAERQTAFGSTPGSTGTLEAEARRDARGAVNVVGTPFYALFKATACVASVVIAAPAAGVIALTDRADKGKLRRQLDEGVGHNCRGSYVLRG